MATRAREKERADWAKGMMRPPWRTAAGRHTETHDRRAHHHESSSHVFFLFVHEAVLYTCFLRQWSLECWRVVHWGMTPAIIRNVVSSLCCTFCQTFREDIAIVYFCMVFFFRSLFFDCMPASRPSDSTPDSRRVLLCAHEHRALRTVQAARQTNTAVVSSHASVSCGNGGNSFFML